MTQNIMTSALEVSGPKKYFFAFSILLDDLAHISAMFILKMQKKSKIGSLYWAVGRPAGGFRGQIYVQSLYIQSPNIYHFKVVFI
jgi:hypothetical protein